MITVNDEYNDPFSEVGGSDGGRKAEKLPDVATEKGVMDKIVGMFFRQVGDTGKAQIVTRLSSQNVMAGDEEAEKQATRLEQQDKKIVVQPGQPVVSVQQKQAITHPSHASHKDISSDLEDFLADRNRHARQRNEMFRIRFDALRKAEKSVEEALDLIKQNPITLRAMSEFSAEEKKVSDGVRREVQRRLADPYSEDASQCKDALKDFHSYMVECFKLARFSLEAALLAPLPELGRHIALKSNLQIFFRLVCDCRELKVHQSSVDSSRTLHQEVARIVTEVSNIFAEAERRLSVIYGQVEQPINSAPILTEEELNGQLTEDMTEDNEISTEGAQTCCE